MHWQQAPNGRVSFTVDPTMYTAQNAVPGAVYADLARAVRPDLRYHYANPICAQRWLDVCDDPAYGHQRLLASIDAVLGDLVAALGARTPVTVVSLGPGDGSVDERVLRGLAAGPGVEAYCGVDFSFELLRRAVHRLGTAAGIDGPFPIQAVCADFTDVQARGLPKPRAGGSRLFTLTGFTLGNYREADLIESIGALMREGDHLLLDARLHGFPTVPDDPTTMVDRSGLCESYDLPTVRRFVFGPAEVATLATADDVRIAISVDRSVTVVPDAINLVIHCIGLDSAMRLTGEPVYRDRLDLAVTSRYRLGALAGWLEGAGFDPIWRSQADDVAFLLLRRQGVRV
jgi:hypothetical protein